MKKAFFSLALVISGLHGQAQTAKYQKAMEQNLASLDTTKTVAGFQKLGSSFERIATTEKTQWLPYYYASYCALKVARAERDLNLIDAKVDKAELLAQTANSISPKNSEIYCLNALVAFARINVDFMTRGPKYSGIGNEALATAQQLDPSNPRPYLLIGQSKFSTPPQFGGDKALACKYFDKANALFATAPASALAPHWGKDEVTKAVGACQQAAATAAAGKK